MSETDIYKAEVLCVCLIHISVYISRGCCMVYFPHHIHHGRLERDGLPIHPSIIHSPHSYIWILDQPQPHTVHVYCSMYIVYCTYYMLHGNRGFKQGWEFRICSLIFRANHWFFWRAAYRTYATKLACRIQNQGPQVGMPHRELRPWSWLVAYSAKALKLECCLQR